MGEGATNLLKEFFSDLPKRQQGVCRCQVSLEENILPVHLRKCICCIQAEGMEKSEREGDPPVRKLLALPSSDPNTTSSSETHITKNGSAGEGFTVNLLSSFPPILLLF